jgi:RND family efflux transporter MFP subunit
VKNGFSIIILFSILLLLGCGEGKPSAGSVPKEEPLREVKVHTLKKRAYPVYIDFTGKTEAFDAVEVVSRVEGELLSWEFVPGEKVEKGELLFRIDSAPYCAAYEHQKALLKKDEAALKLAEASMKRYAPLVEEQLAPREKLDQLSYDIARIRAQIDADRAAVASAELELSYCDIRASIGGYVGKPSKLAGNLVKRGDILGKITDSRKLYIHFYPSIEEAASIRKFSKDPHPEVVVSLDGDRFDTVSLKGRVDFIDPAAVGSSGTVPMRAVVDNPKGLVYPGSFVHIALFLGKYKTLAVHPDQISNDQGGEFVYLVDADGTVSRRYIEPLFANNDMVLIEDSLKEGDRVVTELPGSLEAGMKVSAVEVEDPVKVR